MNDSTMQHFLMMKLNMVLYLPWGEKWALGHQCSAVNAHICVYA